MHKKYRAARINADNVDAVSGIASACGHCIWTREAILSHMEESGSGGLVAFEHKRICGYLLYERRRQEGLISILSLGVDPSPEVRGKGVGKFLLSNIHQILFGEDSVLYHTTRIYVRESDVDAQVWLRKQEYTCNQIAQDWFIDTTMAGTKRENAYGFYLTLLPKEKKDARITVVDRFGRPVHRCHSGSAHHHGPRSREVSNKA